MEVNRNCRKTKKFFLLKKHELRKFIALELLFLCITFNYSALRSLKDVFIIGSVGAETIYYIKTFMVAPMMLVFTLLYSWISIRYDANSRWNWVISYFLLFFILSSVLLIPHCDSLRLDSVADYLTNIIPKFKGLWESIRYWPYSLVFINAEAWGTFALCVCFWTFANDINNTEEAKRMYPLISLSSALGNILAGLCLIYCSNINIQVIIITSVTVVILVGYNLFTRDMKKRSELYHIPASREPKEKLKLSLWQSLKTITKSKYLAFMAIIVLSYNIFISLLESIWKGAIGKYSNVVISNGGDKSAALREIYGIQNEVVGVMTLVMICIASLMTRKKWKTMAIFTPIICVVSSLIFLLGINYTAILEPLSTIFNVYPIFITVMIGLGIVVVIKTTKYIFFDTTKDMAYIPLDKLQKVTGKATVDTIGSRFGKSIGAFIISTILVPIFGGLDEIQSITFIFIFIILTIWMYAVCKLSVEYEKKLTIKKQEESS